MRIILLLVPMYFPKLSQKLKQTNIKVVWVRFISL